MNRLIRNALIVLGVALVLTAAGLAVVMDPTEKSAAAAPKPVQYILIAAKPIAAGERIGKAAIGWRAIGSDAIPSGALLKDGKAEAELVGAIALRNLAEGEMLAEPAFVKAPSARTLAASLNPGWRAITISTDAAQAAAGMILPNDRVDILIADAAEGAGTPQISLPFAKMGGPTLTAGGTMISNIRVIAVNSLMAPTDPNSGVVDDGAKGGGTITIEVPAAQVAQIATASKNGQLVIAVRSRLDSAGPMAQIGPVVPAPPPVPSKSPATSKKRKPAVSGGSAPPTAAAFIDAQPVTVIRGGAGANGQ